MSEPGLVIVGASLAGVRTAKAARRRGYQAPITLIGAEDEQPYDRPPLSKDYLTGARTREQLALDQPGALAELGVELRLGTRATGLDVTAHEVLIGAERLPYDTAVLATGSRPRLLPSAGACEGLAGVVTLRTIADADVIRAAFGSGARVALIGGGFVGAELATSARSLGLDVTLVDPLPALMIRGLGEQVGGLLAARHADNGVRLRLGVGVQELVGGDRIEQLALSDGTTIEADLVIVGIGAVPVVDWLAGSGLSVSASGVVTDDFLQAGPDVYAVGDIAAWSGGTRRAEHWTNACDQAAALGRTLAGDPTRYESVPYVWSDQLGAQLQVLGEPRPGDETVFLDGGPGSAEFVVAMGQDETLHAVASFGARRAALAAQRLLRAGARWRPGIGPVPAGELTVSQ